jgi:hypothetical protein
MPKKQAGPVLTFTRQEKKNFKGSLDADVLEMIEAYPDYYSQETGEKAPTPEEVIEQAIRKTIGKEGGFRKFLDERRTRGASDGAGARAGSSSKGASKSPQQ